MASGRVVQSERDDGSELPRRGSIYTRLDRAREQRVKSLTPQTAANDAPMPAQPAPPKVSKLHRLPTIKSQEAFDPSPKDGLHPVLKLAIGAVAFAAMAGFTLMNWNSTGPQTSVSSPAEVEPAPGALVTQLPSADTPARVADAPGIEGATTDAPPATPAALSESPVVEVQQDTTPLALPDPVDGTPATVEKP